ncbi:MAG: hypothetical protein ACLQAH_14965 [Limisphaerales bacterium]
MKPTKFAFTAIVAALALWAFNAKASLGIPVFEKLNFSLTVVQQGLDFSNSAPDTYVSTVKAAKITNKDLLNFLATAFNTNWPTGAQLALNYGDRHIFVVDKTGTNAVFDVTTGINEGGTNVVYFSFEANSTVFRGKEVLKPAGGSRKEEHFGMIFFFLFSEQNGITNTDLSFQGFDAAKLVESFSTTKTALGVGDKAIVGGDGTMDGAWTVVKGKVTGFGKSKALPPT